MTWLKDCIRAADDAGSMAGRTSWIAGRLSKWRSGIGASGWRDREIALLLGLVWALSGCVSLSLPSIAHVHIGHVLKGWSDTPSQQGLLQVAVHDAKAAADHADFAVQGARDLASVRLHLGHVLHALDPVLEPEGPGSGYGLLRALDGAVEHLGFASGVPDASVSLRAGMPAVLAVLEPLRREVRLLLVLTRDGRSSGDPGQALAYAQEVQVRTKTVVQQIAQAQQHLSSVLTRERPAYRPVAERYLFGLIRLPSGEWAFAERSLRRRAGAY